MSRIQSSPVRVQPADYGIESGTKPPRVLVYDNASMWPFHTHIVFKDFLSRNDVVLTQFLTEAERVAKEKGPFNAHVINLDRRVGTEYHIQDGIDLGEIIRETQGNESVWFLTENPGHLERARQKNFTRLYMLSRVEVDGYPGIDKYVEDIRQELMYGRRAL